METAEYIIILIDIIMIDMSCMVNLLCGWGQVHLNSEEKPARGHCLGCPPEHFKNSLLNMYPPDIVSLYEYSDLHSTDVVL